ncbi:MAG: amino acid racemase [Bacillota bacterium]|nr:amino acid racemase [Bacillota bacterium]
MVDATDMKLGVIGGLGPMATAFFLERVIGMTDAACDQEHLEMIIYNVPSIPDRTRYILGLSKDNPVPPMIRIGRRLVEQGVACIAIPCVTAHYFYRELSEAINRPIIHAIRETVGQLRQQGVKAAGVAATDGTLSGRLFQEELEQNGIRSIVPGLQMQQTIMDLIYQDIKAGQAADMERFDAVSDEMRRNGAETIILGCTELSLIKRDNLIGSGYLDVMDVLAKAAIITCGRPLKTEYTNLIT